MLVGGSYGLVYGTLLAVNRAISASMPKEWLILAISPQKGSIILNTLKQSMYTL
jgi:hypothetical protein